MTKLKRRSRDRCSNEHSKNTRTRKKRTSRNRRHLLDTQAITGKDVMTIAALAYALYEQCGREDGYDLDVWLEAEHRIVSRGQGRGF